MRFFLNLLFVPTFVVALGLFLYGRRIATNVSSVRLILVAGVVAVLAAVPALLFVAYYAHVLDTAAWFYAFRTVPYTELTASGLGFGAGMAAGMINRIPLVNSSRLLTRLTPAVLLLCLSLVILAPYAKPLLIPIQTLLMDRWKDGICIQTTPSTCGPSSAATLLNYFGIHATERELARECFTCGSGTENWYLARALWRRGVQTDVQIVAAQTPRPPFPSIAGTEYGGRGGSGHFITILAEENGQYLIGDPLSGRMALSSEKLRSRYFLTGFFLVAHGRPARPY